MQSNKLKNNLVKPFIATVFCAVLLSSCSTKMKFQNSAIVPSAEGSVKVKKDENKNYHIDLNVIRLANAERLSPPKKMYIVWMTTSDNGTQKLGRLATSSNLFSSTLKSSLETSVPYKPTSFFITAEDDVNIQEPKGQEVLSTK